MVQRRADASGLARYRTELVGNGARQYLVIERYDRSVDGETVTLIHQEDAAQALGLDWVDDHAKFQDPLSPRDSRRPSAYRIAELLGSLQGEGHPVADFLRRLTFSVLLGDIDAHAKNLGILHLPPPACQRRPHHPRGRKLERAQNRGSRTDRRHDPDRLRQGTRPRTGPAWVPTAAAAQLAWNVERLQAGDEIGERPSGYRRRRP